MKELIRKLIYRIPLLWHLYIKIRGRYQVRDWIQRGKPSPPPSIVKQAILHRYAVKFNLHVFVETGTHYGDTVEAMRYIFHRIYSVELDSDLFEKAKVRFKGASHIKLINGDSALELGPILNNLHEPALFWLDGHYSGGNTAKSNRETPILEELKQIFTAPELGHVVVIDDARCFGSDPAYPTLDELHAYVRSMRPHAFVEIMDDSIRITPTQMAQGRDTRSGMY